MKNIKKIAIVAALVIHQIACTKMTPSGREVVLTYRFINEKRSGLSQYLDLINKQGYTIKVSPDAMDLLATRIGVGTGSAASEYIKNLNNDLGGSKRNSEKIDGIQIKHVGNNKPQTTSSGTTIDNTEKPLGSTDENFGDQSINTPYSEATGNKIPSTGGTTPLSTTGGMKGNELTQGTTGITGENSAPEVNLEIPPPPPAEEKEEKKKRK